MSNQLTPRQIVQELDKYIIGQDEAKKSVAIALRNRWRRQQVEEDLRNEIMPNNIIMIGPTGVGKTEIARRLAKLTGAPFIKIEATKFTEVGYVGRDVDSMIRDLVDYAVNMVREENTGKVQEKAKIHAEQRILDVLIPPSGDAADKPVVHGPGFVMNSDDEKQDASETEDQDGDLRERTRARFLEKLRNGDLDEREVEIDVASDASPMMQVFGPMGMEEMGVNLQDLFGNMSGRRRKKRRLSVAEARELLTQEEAQKLIDMEAVTKEAIERVEQSGMVFVDEIDKVSGGQADAARGPDVSREGVQRDLLPIVEGSTVTTKHGIVKTDHILFIASGAFHVSKPSDLIPELQGRFPIRVELQNLDENDFFLILTTPKNALLKQYTALLETEGVKLSFTDDAIRAVARIAAEVNSQVENIGARRLHTILTTLLEDYLFDIPDDMPEGDIVVSEQEVEDRLRDLVKNRDLSQYIL